MRGLLLLLAFPGARATAQTTESPSAVAPGDWLVEADLMSVAFHREAAAQGTLRGSTAVVGAVFLTTGIASGFDIQLGTQLYHRDRVSGPGFREVVSGRGDTYLRMKWNFAGDEGGGPAFALLPWVKFPTATAGVGNNEADWGLIVPFGMPLPGEGAFNAMVEFARPADGEGGRESTWFFGAVAVMPLAEGWECYAEATAGFVSGDSESTATLGGGLRWSVSDSFVLDFGVAAGLTDNSPHWNPVVRVEWGF
ncbi:MAG TPA: transporter [Opitutaceae bacterium]